MAPIGKLYLYPENHKGKLVRAVAAYSDLDVEMPAFVHNVTVHTPEYRAKFPHGQIPAFEGVDGYLLYETPAVARYLAALNPSAGLLGKNLKEAALIDQFVHLSQSEVGENTKLIFHQTLGKHLAIDQNFVEHRHAAELRGLHSLEKHIAASPSGFFVGDQLTLADITVADYVHRSAVVSTPPEEREKIPKLIEHMNRILNHDKLKAIFIPFQMCSGPPQLPAKPAA